MAGRVNNYGVCFMVDERHCDGLQHLLVLLDANGHDVRAIRIALTKCNGDLNSNLPPLWIRGVNFATALARWTVAGMPRRTQAEIDERLAICQSCPELVDNHCGKCGCACVETNKVMNKLALSTEACPLGKWK